MRRSRLDEQCRNSETANPTSEHLKLQDPDCHHSRRILEQGQAGPIAPRPACPASGGISEVILEAPTPANRAGVLPERHPPKSDGSAILEIAGRSGF